MGIDYIDFIWCDVEGNTGETVEGGLNILKKTKYFYTEARDNRLYGYEGELLYPDILKLMESIGFELVVRFESDVLFKNKALVK